MHKLKYLPFYLFSYLPFWMLYALSNLGFFVLYRLVKYRREVVRNNLINAFPNHDLQTIIKTEKAFYRHFCDVSLESLKAISLPAKRLQKRFKFKNIELLHDLQKEGQNCILYTGHIGNWEWFSVLPLSVKQKVSTFYQTLSNGYYDQLMQNIRSRFGIMCIESQKGYKTILQLKAQNTLTINLMIGDQSPRKSAVKHWTTFFGQETAFLIGAEKIAKKSDQALVYPHIKNKTWALRSRVCTHYQNPKRS